MALKASGITSAETVMLMSAILWTPSGHSVTPCAEVVAVRTVPGAVSPGCTLAVHPGRAIN